MKFSSIHICEEILKREEPARLFLKMSSAELLDNRGRKVLGTVAEWQSGKYCVVCTICHGEFVDVDNFTTHLVLHGPIKVEKSEKATVRSKSMSINKVFGDCVIVSSDDEDAPKAGNSKQTTNQLPKQTRNQPAGRAANDPFVMVLSSDSESEESAARTRVLRKRPEKRARDSVEDDIDSLLTPQKRKKFNGIAEPSDSSSDSDFELFGHSRKSIVSKAAPKTPEPPKTPRRPAPASVKLATSASVKSATSASVKSATSAQAKSATSASTANCVEQYECKYCDKMLNSVLEANAHADKCVNWQKYLKICNFCPAKYPYKQSLDKHYRKEHQKELPEQCELCVKCFATKQDLIDHKRSKHITGIVINCTSCNKRFSSKFEKDNHVRLEHPWGEFECDDCGRTEKTQHALNEHIKNAHRNHNLYSTG